MLFLCQQLTVFHIQILQLRNYRKLTECILRRLVKSDFFSVGLEELPGKAILLVLCIDILGLAIVYDARSKDSDFCHPSFSIFDLFGKL